MVLKKRLEMVENSLYYIISLEDVNFDFLPTVLVLVGIEIEIISASSSLIVFIS